VSGGGIKPWRQKGTGRARSGSIRNPQFRGGGVVFGPRGEENYSLNINKKLKKKVLQSLLGEKMRQQNLIIIDQITLGNYKAKEAEQLLTNLLYKDLRSKIEKLKQEIKVLKTAEQEKELTEKEGELAKLKKKQKTKTLIILAYQENKKVELLRSFRNLPYVNVSDSKLVNSQQILSSNYLIFTQSAFSEMEKRLG
jgi:ribosomal protein L4